MNARVALVPLGTDMPGCFHAYYYPVAGRPYDVADGSYDECVAEARVLADHLGEEIGVITVQEEI